MWHYRREKNSTVNTITKPEIEPSFFTYVNSAAATGPSTHELKLVAKVFKKITCGGAVVVLRLYSLEQ
jgi:hypothetical protein